MLYLIIIYFTIFELSMQLLHSNRSRHSSLLQSHASLGIITNEKIVTKGKMTQKISLVNLEPYLNGTYPTFIDPDFPHIQSSIFQEQTPSKAAQHRWIPAQKINKNYTVNYSNNISDIDYSLFAKKSIVEALLVINWFASQSLSDILVKDINQMHLYHYEVMIDGMMVLMPIDSYVPVKSNGEELYSSNVGGSVFPCLYEKLLAKIYGTYQAITNEMIDIVELQTKYCRERITLTNHLPLPQINQILTTKLNQKSILGFQTRNSISLQSLGLQSNQLYIITRIITLKNKVQLIQFLQLDGQKWIGKYSKIRSEWELEDSQDVANNSIVKGTESKENYMLVEDMRGVSRALIVLNNTRGWNKNFVRGGGEVCFYEVEVGKNNRIIVRANFIRNKCYNLLLIVKVEGSLWESSSKYCLVASNFNECSDGNYISCDLEKGKYLIGVYGHNLHQKQEMSYNITLFSSDQFLQIADPHTPTSSQLILVQTLKAHILSINHHTKSTSELIFKEEYQQFGHSFLIINKPSKAIMVKMDLRSLGQHKIRPILANGIKPNASNQQLQLTFEKGTLEVVVFRCLWNRKENISNLQQGRIRFPPKDAIQIFTLH